MNDTPHFSDRADAARKLADLLRQRKFHRPLVLAIPRGGVVTGAVLARELGAELDVVLSRKLRAPGQPELAIGAISEDGLVYLDPANEESFGDIDDYLSRERQQQLREIARRRQLIRQVRPAAEIAGRSVILTDDGIATGSTMIAALQALRPRHPRELIVAVPVASPDRLRDVRHWCDDIVYVHASPHFWAIGQFYDDFSPIEDEQVLRLLRESQVAVPLGDAARSPKCP
jgi:hypothetical protein